MGCLLKLTTLFALTIGIQLNLAVAVRAETEPPTGEQHTLTLCTTPLDAFICNEDPPVTDGPQGGDGGGGW